jgi:hypothetical protein
MVNKIRLPELDKPSVFDVFWWGVGYGQLLMEEERDMEEWGDAFQGFILDRKYCMPANPAPRRQPKSEEWRASMMGGSKKYQELLKEKAKGERNEKST